MNSMNFEMIEQLVKFWYENGNYPKVELAALEPLLYNEGGKNIVDVCRMTSKYFIPSITTNAFLLGKYFFELKEYVNKIRVSIHAMDRERYKKIMGFDGFEKVIKNIRQAKEAGLNISLNRVLLRGYTDDLKKQIDFIDQLGINLKIFDLYYTQDISVNYEKYYISIDEALRNILEDGTITFDSDCIGNRDRVIFKTKNGSRVEYKKHATISKNNPPCSQCQKQQYCIEGYMDYLRVFPNGKATFCYMRQELDFPIIDQNGVLQIKQQNCFKNIPLRLCVIDTCNYNCGFPDDKNSWCLKRFRPFTYLARR